MRADGGVRAHARTHACMHACTSFLIEFLDLRCEFAIGNKGGEVSTKAIQVGLSTAPLTHSQTLCNI